MPNPNQPLSSAQKSVVCGLVVFFAALGIVTWHSGAGLSKRHTDADVFFRAAWAARAGKDLGTVTDTNGWHWLYPPLMAILAAPFADGPDGVSRAGMLPYPVSVVLWYVVTLGLGLWGVHMLASALEATGREPVVRWSQRWWALRIWPLLILLPAIGRSQVRGQINLPLAFLFCGMGAAILRGHRGRAGLWLAAAICIKAIPAFLLLGPLWRRDWRMLGACALGLVVGLAIVPAAALGPQRTVQAYRSFVHETLLAGAAGDTGGSRGKELTGVSSTDTNAPVTVMHNLMYPTLKERDLHPTAAPAIRMAHWAIAVVLTLITLAAAGRNPLPMGEGRARAGSLRGLLPGTRSKTKSPHPNPLPPGEGAIPSGGDAPGVWDVMFMGALIVLMWTTSPVFHLHYVAMGLPLVMVILAACWERYGYGRLPRAVMAVFILLFAAHTLTLIRPAEMGTAPQFLKAIFGGLRDFGLVLVSALALWATAVALMWRERPRVGREP